ncbi:ACP phosphodiesterase [Serratia microhaemolytica]|uniref:acyl carrier protein phosphodiesterase n=1 Tax=Serratia microhaemolytica TaxID=2675110 RepID=UPI000FDE88EA|nr:ACP phosphodiesterase [Serratia microhaemolytica]
MNFLAHLHLAKLAQSSLAGNLLADFVRGNPQGQFEQQVVAGIIMHRRVDVFTDRQPEVSASRLYFSQPLRRIAPITLDIVWDHFLARDWQQLESEYSLPAFAELAAAQITPYLPKTPVHFQQLNHALWHERWLERYAELPFIGEVLQRMSRRRPRLAALADSFAEVTHHYSALEAQFWQLYPRMMRLARDQHWQQVGSKD